MNSTGGSLSRACLLLLLWGCGNGADIAGDIGICDGYPATSSSKYVLPYASGTGHVIGQGNCTGASHYGRGRYSYDIGMDIGTTVIAARAGTVKEIKEDLVDGKGCPEGNHVSITHDDGTVAEYYHLTQDGAIVAAGDSVTQGQAIGKSGNTGCSSGPHLHFVVWKADKTDSMAVSFSNTGTSETRLSAGSTYTAQ